LPRSGYLRQAATAAGIGLVCAALAGVVAFVVASRQPTMYESTVSLVAPTMGDTFAELVDTPSLVDHVAAAVGLTSVDIARNVSAKASKTSALLTVSARDGDPRVATSVATAVANELVNMAPTVSGSSSAAQQAIESDLSTVETQITATEQAIAGFGETPSAAQQVQVTALQSQLATLLSVRSSLLDLRIRYSQGVLTILGPASIPGDPVSPQPVLAAAVAALLGLTLGITATWAVSYLRGRGP